MEKLNNHKLTNLYLDREQIKTVKKVCADLEISMAEFFRQAIKEKLERTSSTGENHG